MAMMMTMTASLEACACPAQRSGLVAVPQVRAATGLRLLLQPLQTVAMPMETQTASAPAGHGVAACDPFGNAVAFRRFLPHLL